MIPRTICLFGPLARKPSRPLILVIRPVKLLLLVLWPPVIPQFLLLALLLPRPRRRRLWRLFLRRRLTCLFIVFRRRGRPFLFIVVALTRLRFSVKLFRRSGRELLFRASRPLLFLVPQDLLPRVRFLFPFTLPRSERPIPLLIPVLFLVLLPWLPLFRHNSLVKFPRLLRLMRRPKILRVIGLFLRLRKKRPCRLLS